MFSLIYDFAAFILFGAMIFFLILLNSNSKIITMHKSLQGQRGHSPSKQLNHINISHSACFYQFRHMVPLFYTSHTLPLIILPLGFQVDIWFFFHRMQGQNDVVILVLICYLIVKEEHGMDSIGFGS